MANGGGDALLATIVEGHHAAVAQRQLQHALTLLAGNLSRHRAVYLVGKPVLAGHDLQLEHALHVFFYLVLTVGYILIVALHGVVAHDGFRRVAEHLGHVEVEGLHAVALAEGEMGVAGGLAHDVERGALALGYLAHMVNMLFVDEQAHALLALVGNDFLRREGLVANGQLGHVNLAAALLDQLRQAVQVAGRAVVVDAHHGVDIFLAEGTHQVVGAFLHLGVGTLHGVELSPPTTTILLPFWGSFFRQSRLVP